MSESKKIEGLCFGEILFDLLDQQATPGGAPMNVAINLEKLGMRSALISRVGDDPYGHQLISFLEKKNVCTSFIQKDDRRDTGTVRVNLDRKDDPTYNIVEKVAFDYIDSSFLDAQIDPKYVIHGSLVCRSEESQHSLSELLTSTRAKIVFDLNIRSPFYSKSVIAQLLKTAHIVKMNQEEFNMIRKWFYIKNPHIRGDLKAIQALYPNIEIILLTQGGKKAIAWQDGKMETTAALQVEVADTIGSGDAFLGAFISRLDHGKSLGESLRFASALGALVATHEGANPEYNEEDILKLISASSN